MQRFDVELVERAIRERLGGRVRDLRLRRTEQHIELHGIVMTFHAKQLVQAVALALAGEARIVNLVDVPRHGVRPCDERRHESSARTGASSHHA
jgi:hypothetical protein